MKRKRRDPPWTPFEKAHLVEEDPHKQAAAFGCSVEDVLKAREADYREFVAIWKNSLYTVLVYRPKVGEGWPEMWWLSIRRNDRRAIHDWRHFQRIKNELIGPEYEGIELYPAESRLVDTSNQYHMWVLKDPKIRFPFGFPDREVRDRNQAAEQISNARQRALDSE